MTIDEREMKIKDFYGACLLKSLGYPLLRIDHGDGDFLIFVFDDPDYTAETQLSDYWDGLVTINARTLIDNIKELKTRLHTRIRG